MNNISIKSLLNEVNPNKNSNILKIKRFENFINNFLCFNKVNTFLKKTEKWSSIEFIDELFDYIDFSYYTSHIDKQKIPSEGKLLIVANHPLGGLDALSLILCINEVRPDLKILANELLINIEQLNEIIIPIDVFSKQIKRSTLLAIHNTMINEQALIIFPAGEVSRFNSGKISDKSWSKSVVSISKKYNSPILPIYIDAHNSMFFYLISKLNKNFSTALLPREIFKKTNKRINLKIGNIIPSNAINSYMKEKQIAKLLKKHTYRIGLNKSGIFITEKNIVHPKSQKLLKIELNMSLIIQKIDHNKNIFLTNYSKSKNVVNEVARLRELTYRKVGEGTGKKSDKDEYDKICDHLILWDNERLDIIGAYRLGDLSNIISKYGINKVYNSDLFEFNPKFENILNETVELGRSFIQEKYWRTNALDNLWKGIGSYLIKKPNLKYMFGAVSLSNNYSDMAKNLIIYYYQKWYFDNDNNYLKAKYPYEIPKLAYKQLYSTLDGKDFQSDFLNLKKALKGIGFSVPILLRKYTELCEYGGVKFLSFGIDKSFNNSIDCIILIDVNKIKEEYKQRYMNRVIKDVNKIVVTN